MYSFDSSRPQGNESIFITTVVADIWIAPFSRSSLVPPILIRRRPNRSEEMNLFAKKPTAKGRIESQPFFTFFSLDLFNESYASLIVSKNSKLNVPLMGKWKKKIDWGWVLMSAVYMLEFLCFYVSFHVTAFLWRVLNMLWLQSLSEQARGRWRPPPEVWFSLL